MKSKKSSLETLIWQAMELYPVEALDQFLSDKDEKVRLAAARRLQISGGEHAFSLALKFLESRKASDRVIGLFILGQLNTPDFSFKKKSIPIIISVLNNDKSINVKSEAIISLGHLSAESSIDEISGHANHPSERIRAAVAIALSRFPKSKKAKKVLAALKNDRSSLVKYWTD